LLIHVVIVVVFVVCGIVGDGVGVVVVCDNMIGGVDVAFAGGDIGVVYVVICIAVVILVSVVCVSAFCLVAVVSVYCCDVRICAYVDVVVVDDVVVFVAGVVVVGVCCGYVVFVVVGCVVDPVVWRCCCYLWW